MNKLFNFINIKVFLTIVISIFLLDFFGGIIIFKLFKNSKSGIALKEKVIFFETDQDGLIFGSSRAAFHYVPSFFEDKKKMSFYNAGREGTGIFFEYAVLIATLERYQPKIIILDVDFRDIYDRGGDFGVDVFSQLNPYYGLVNDEFDSYITRKPIDYILNQSNLLKFNKKFLNIITANISSNDKTIKGFKPLLNHWDGSNAKNQQEVFKYSQKHVDVLEDFIVKAKKNNIELVLVISPTNKIMPENFNKIIKDIALKHNVKCFDFYNSMEFKDKKYFNDVEHLNDLGAQRFSMLLSSKL
jgi:hypothetical protein